MIIVQVIIKQSAFIHWGSSNRSIERKIKTSKQTGCFPESRHVCARLACVCRLCRLRAGFPPVWRASMNLPLREIACKVLVLQDRARSCLSVPSESFKQQQPCTQSAIETTQAAWSLRGKNTTLYSLLDLDVLRPTSGWMACWGQKYPQGKNTFHFSCFFLSEKVISGVQVQSPPNWNIPSLFLSSFKQLVLLLCHFSGSTSQNE